MMFPFVRGERMGYKIIDVLLPILIHFLALQCTALFGGMDAAFRTMLASLLTMPLFYAWYREDERFWSRSTKKITWYAALLTVAAAAALNLLFSSILSALAAEYGISNQTQEELLSGRMVFQILGMGLIVPVTEELVFRGLVYRRLERYLPGAAAVLLGAALFAAYHGNLLQVLFAFPMGIVLILLYRHYGTLKMPILFHAASNLTAILLGAGI